MEIMHNYSDLLTEIELTKEQIDYTEKELEYWFGIDLKEGKGIPFDGVGGYKFGINAALEQTDKKVTSLSRLQKRLKELEYTRVRTEMLLEKFEGLEYKIAYHRIVNNMTHQEIADELRYSHQYIKERWARLKTYKEPTETVDVS
ncbi:hypothetical protein [Virgibacillus sp. CBA3643]|uniref:hypothetical protein n=1 Tax=Virgibacillus sp. CBA3643 TaxID=2942278 RepID=UPI0035A29688